MRPLPLPAIPDLRAELIALLSEVTIGRATTYGDLARSLGDVAAAKWIATELLDAGSRVHTKACRCHRVVRHGGDVGLWAHGTPEQKALELRRESVEFDSGRVAGTIELPARDCLQQLRDWQRRAASAVDAIADADVGGGGPEVRIAGLDVSYPPRGRAVAACVTVDPSTGEPTDVAFGEIDQAFPYIRGYLTFREVPALAAAFEALCERSGRPDLCIIDGNGRLHPRAAGVATCFTAVTGCPSIGVAKSHLFGRVDGDGDRRPVFGSDAGRPIGYQLRSRTARMKSDQWLDVSPGAGIDPETAAAVVESLLGNTRLPSPTHWADRLSREEARRRQ